MIIRIYDDDGSLQLCISGWQIPVGAILRECYETDTEIVVCGEPKENDVSHNCDEMGCSSVNHVLYRFRK
jgi:hypothetical protein